MDTEEASKQSEDHDFWLEVRQALLALVDVIERRLGIEPSTSELRKMFRRSKAG